VSVAESLPIADDGMLLGVRCRLSIFTPRGKGSHRKQRHTGNRIFKWFRDEHGYTGKITVAQVSASP
jgi:hypothetical protein